GKVAVTSPKVPWKVWATAAAAVCLLAAVWVLARVHSREDHPPGTLLSTGESVRAVALAPDGRTLASAGGWYYAAGEVNLWDRATGRLLATLRGHTGSVEAAAFSPDGRTLATAGYDGTVRLWDVATAREQSTLLVHSQPLLALAYAPDGRS